MGSDDVKKQLQIFMTGLDEQAFSENLVRRFPAIAFIDGNRWHTDQPPLQPAINLCQNNFVFLWNRQIVTSLPVYRRKDGQFEGPSTGYVIQFDRSRLQGLFLLSGSIGIGMSHKQPHFMEMEFFQKEIWKELNSLTSPFLISVDPVTRKHSKSKPVGYRIGADATAWVRKHPDNLLKDRASNFFLPIMKKDQ